MGERKAGVRAAAVSCVLLLGGCAGTRASRFRATRTRDRRQGPRPTPIRGKGGTSADDFNGDGRRDLVLNDLVKKLRRRPRRRRGHRDRLRNRSRAWTRARRTAVARPGAPSSPYEGPVARRLRRGGELRPGRGRLHRSRRVDGPAVRRPGPAPVPSRSSSATPAGLTGKAVKLVIPEGARAGDDWPDQPVCGDFDGDGAEDLVVHASDGRLGICAARHPGRAPRARQAPPLTRHRAHRPRRRREP